MSSASEPVRKQRGLADAGCFWGSSKPDTNTPVYIHVDPSYLPRALLLFILVIRPFHMIFSSSSSSSPLPSSSAEPWNREVFSVAGPPGTASAPKALLQWRSCWVPTRNTRSVQRSSWGSGWLSKQDAIWNLQGSHCLQDGSARVPAEKDVAVMPDLVETMVVSASDCLCRHGRPKMRLVADLKPSFYYKAWQPQGSI